MKTHSIVEGGVKVCEEGVVGAKSQDSFLDHGALHIIILQHHILLQCLHSKELLRSNLLS